MANRTWEIGGAVRWLVKSKVELHIKALCTLVTPMSLQMGERRDKYSDHADNNFNNALIKTCQLNFEYWSAIIGLLLWSDFWETQRNSKFYTNSKLINSNNLLHTWLLQLLLKLFLSNWNNWTNWKWWLMWILFTHFVNNYFIFFQNIGSLQHILKPNQHVYLLCCTSSKVA